MKSSSENQGIVVRCDPEGTVEEVMSDGLGLAHHVPVGSHVSNLADPACEEKMRHFLEEARTTKSAFNWEITVLLDGRLKPLHFSAWLTKPGLVIVAADSRNGLADLTQELVRINNEQTNALRATAKDLAAQTSRDDTVYEDFMRVNNDLANLQREMVRKNAALTKLNEEKNRLLGMAAHDLRNPLGIIQVYSEFLETEAAPSFSKEHRQFLATIKDTCRLLLRMVGDLLDVTAIESGILRLERISCDLPALVAHNVELNRVLAGPKRIDVGFDPPKDFPEVFLDPEKIGQVLNNLIGNAVKFSHPGTSVRVTLGQEDGSARIAVEDQGQGIPAADLNKLFKPFGKASVRGTAGEKSTGLGLAIVRRIVEGHGGKISVTSTVDKGSQFVFYIPINRPCG
ncbi:MAG: HAMP domain-containing sensor histidine kinase [Verrucomicrobiota bacterium]